MNIAQILRLLQIGLEPMNALTDAQNDAAKQIYHIMSEHFDGALFALSTSVTVDQEDREATRVMWSGGHTLALGLCEEAKDYLQQRRSSESEP